MTPTHSHYYLLFIAYLLIGCTSPSPLRPDRWQFFRARDNDSTLNRPLLYRAQVPSHWKRKDPPSNQSIIDTTEAICAFTISEGQHSIRLTIHTFPILGNQIRIPPQAQVARWKGQFEELDPITTVTTKEAHGGFHGLFFEGEGIIEKTPITVIGWSMQLAPSYARQLQQEDDGLNAYKRADYTIKASGPPKLMKIHRSDIIAFAHSFELIDELPALP
ncbi:MAG: hypothetical protein ACH350_00750 [Parachlamydiaceae bacterium]